MNLELLHNNEQLILFKCISGSKSYGLALPTSDTDIKGVFMLPQRDFYSLDYTEQVNDEMNNEVYYELKRFIDLLQKNNPNILELLSTPDDCILFKHPLINKIKPEYFLSKQCKDSFAGYAMTQIKKAKGLNKKILNPVDKELKSVLDFCFAVKGQGTQVLSEWLTENKLEQSDCGLVNMAHMKDIYALYHVSQFTEPVRFKGVVSGEAANDVSLSSIPANVEPLTLLSFNKDGYSKYRKDYHQYWEWVGRRNEERYENTVQHGKNYDSKNMMHVFRLLNMAEEIATERKLNMRRKDREYLLRIRAGEFMYEDLVAQATEQIDRINTLYEKCDLPETPDKNLSNNLLIELREELYKN